MAESINSAAPGITPQNITTNVEVFNGIEMAARAQAKEGLANLYEFCRLIYPENADAMFRTFQQELFKWQYMKSIKQDIIGATNGLFPSRFEREFSNITKIGSGLDCEVYSATHNIDQQIYAVKKISLDYDDEACDSVFQEAKIMATINHPNVIRYYTPWVEFDISKSPLLPSIGYDGEDNNDCNDDEEESEYDSDDYYDEEEEETESSTSSSKSINIVPQQGKKSPKHMRNRNIRVSFFIQMELCSKISVSTLCQSIDTISILKKAKLLAEGLAHIHSLGIIHRDIKPSNILIGMDGQPKIADFGISVNKNHINEDAMESATDMYASPEHYDSSRISAKSDIYSFGVTLFDLLISFRTNMEHIKAIIALKKDRKLPDRFIEKYSHFNGLCELILSMSDPSPEKRPTADEVIDIIDKILIKYK